MDILKNVQNEISENLFCRNSDFSCLPEDAANSIFEKAKSLHQFFHAENLGDFFCPKRIKTCPEKILNLILNYFINIIIAFMHLYIVIL